MLKRADITDFEDITALCRNRLLGVRILCYIAAYGFERDFLEIWIIKEEDGLTGVFIKFYDDITLLCEENTDFEQLKAFIGMFYFKTLTCSAATAKKLGFEATVKKGYIFNANTDCAECDLLEEEDYRAAYKLISKEIPDSFSSDKQAYLSFLSDFTFKKRRELARGVCTHINGELSSVALTSAETQVAAIISGVACDKNLQKRGLGKATVLSLVKILADNNKKAYVIALNECAEGFYEHIGFTQIEKIAFIERDYNV